MTVPVLAEAEPFYGLPLAQFTAARDARARALRDSDQPLADAVKALKKPSLAAWVVNLLVRREPDQVAQLVAVGEALRDAAASLDASQLRELTKQRRQLTAALTTVARRHAAAEGQTVTSSVADEVESTLTAAMLDAGIAQAVRSGLLVRSLSTTGLGDVDPAGHVAVPEALGHLATSTPTTLHAVPDPSAAAQRREAKQALTRADRELKMAREAADRAAKRHQGLQAQVLQVEAELDEVRRKVADLEAKEESLGDQLDKAATSMGTAAEEVRAAEQTRTRAADELDSLS